MLHRVLNRPGGWRVRGGGGMAEHCPALEGAPPGVPAVPWSPPTRRGPEGYAARPWARGWGWGRSLTEGAPAVRRSAGGTLGERRGSSPRPQRRPNAPGPRSLRTTAGHPSHEGPSARSLPHPLPLRVPRSTYTRVQADTRAHVCTHTPPPLCTALARDLPLCAFLACSRDMPMCTGKRP